MNQNNFTDKFGRTFQSKLLKLLFDNKELEFVRSIVELLKEEYFDDDSCKIIMQWYSKYYKEYKNIPPMEYFAAETKKLSSDVQRTSVKEALKQIYISETLSEKEYIMNETQKFCLNQNLKNAILESVDLLQFERYDDIKTKIVSALNVGKVRDTGHIYKEDFDLRYDIPPRNVVSTGFNYIDEITGGGLSAGELGVIMGNPGGGKSWFVVDIGVAALLSGKTVYHFTNELSDIYTALRYDARLTGINVNDLKFHKDEVKRKLEEINDHLVIKELLPYKANVNTLECHIENSISRCGEPGLIIVDYPDYMIPVHSNTKNRDDQDLGNIYVELRGLAKQYKCPIWAPSQLQRSAAREKIVEGDRAAGSYQKVMVGDLVVALSRRWVDKLNGSGRFCIIKNRFGPDGLIINSSINLANGEIKMLGLVNDADDTFDQDEESTTRKWLGQKYNELNLDK